jgi:hypothetical protein
MFAAITDAIPPEGTPVRLVLQLVDKNQPQPAGAQPAGTQPAGTQPEGTSAEKPKTAQPNSDPPKTGADEALFGEVKP